MKNTLPILFSIFFFNGFSQSERKIFYPDNVECYFDNDSGESLKVYDNFNGTLIQSFEIEEYNHRNQWFKIAIKEYRDEWFMVENILVAPQKNDSLNLILGALTGKWIRAEYGEKIVATVAKQLELKFGKSYTLRNVRRMRQFSVEFPDIEIVTSLMTQLSWTHFLELLPLKKVEQKLFYAKKIGIEKWSVRETKRQIERKAYERNEIALVQATDELSELKDNFKDPYFLDFLGLKDGYLENDLESAIIKELENFILELGTGFSFIERQKRLILDGKDFYLDLLFYHRKLKRLVAIELKLGEFKPSHKGQMELYLKWLDKYEKQEGEQTPIGLILCAGKSQEQIELLEMHKDGIMVAEYWTELPPKEELEKKLHSLMIEAKERVEQRKHLLE